MQTGGPPSGQFGCRMSPGGECFAPFPRRGSCQGTTKENASHQAPDSIGNHVDKVFFRLLGTLPLGEGGGAKHSPPGTTRHH